MSTVVRNTPTEWFSMDLRPAIPGVYEFHIPAWPYNGTPSYSYWSGTDWGNVRTVADHAEAARDIRCVVLEMGYVKGWRGVVEKPEWA